MELYNIQNIGLNRSNNTLKVQNYRINNKEKIQLIKINKQTIERDKYLNIARQETFNISQIIGKYVDSDPASATYGRHIMPPRILI
jgi:hypothetical protein